jgi:adenine-specific DNA-methyltransferase
LEPFVTEETKRSRQLLYPRDTTLDPQYVWRGKDEQDGDALRVEAPPIYIQERVRPEALVKDLIAVGAGQREAQLHFFDEEPEPPFERKIEFYQHEQRWENRMILGDSLAVMASLADRESLRGRVQMIYLDPPYGIRFGSNWQVATNDRDMQDGKLEDVTNQPEQIKAFRDTWVDGVHTYLAYLRDRFTVARDLLSETGSIFIQISDVNLHRVTAICDEVFGSENFVTIINYVTANAQTGRLIENNCNYLVWFTKNKESARAYPLLNRKQDIRGGGAAYRLVELPDGTRRAMSAEERQGRTAVPKGARVFRGDKLASRNPPGSFPVTFDGKTWLPDPGYWSTGERGMANLARGRRLYGAGKTLYYVRYIDDFDAFAVGSQWNDTITAGFASEKVYVVQTNRKVVQRCMLMTTDPGDLVLDPTCGSGTTASVAEQWGRRWITIDTSRVALTLARTRLMAGRYPAFMLADSSEGRQKEAELSGLPQTTVPVGNDLTQGFVYQRIPHVTLRSIANNPELRDGMTKSEIESAVLRHADIEPLRDRPYERVGVVRVTGPFTFESLSPTGMSDDVGVESLTSESYLDRILANLRKAGVQNTRKGERMTFASVDPFPGVFINGIAVTDNGQRVAIAVGPEYGTVGAEFHRKAGKEALSVADTLIVCGFAFEGPYNVVTELGPLTILNVRMNVELQMPDDVLKKTGTGNLFTVFGEPDIEVRSVGEEIVVELFGVDVYNPATRSLRAERDTSAIAAWFIDTDYDGEGFFVRHVYFGRSAQDPFKALKRALRADIPEDVWDTLASMVSRPFPKPKSGRIAVKVINRYGDEVLKVYEVKARTSDPGTRPG